MRPQLKNPRPLDSGEARKAVGLEASADDLAQAQKLFTCAHGITLNWRQARLRLGLPVHPVPIGEQI